MKVLMRTYRLPVRGDLSRQILANWVFAAALLALLWATPEATAQQVPPNLEAAIHLRVLSHDRGLKSRVGDKLIIAILIDPRSGVSTRRGKVMDVAFRRLAEKAKVQNMKASVQIFRMDQAGWVKRLESAGVDALYLPPGFKKNKAVFVAKLGERLKVATLTNQRSYLAAGLTVAVTEKKGRYVLVVHVEAARRAGVVLSDRLMRRAERWKK